MKYRITYPMHGHKVDEFVDTDKELLERYSVLCTMKAPWNIFIYNMIIPSQVYIDGESIILLS